MLYVADLIKDDDDKFLVLILIQMVNFSCVLSACGERPLWNGIHRHHGSPGH